MPVLKRNLATNSAISLRDAVFVRRLSNQPSQQPGEIGGHDAPPSGVTGVTRQRARSRQVPQSSRRIASRQVTTRKGSVTSRGNPSGWALLHAGEATMVIGASGVVRLRPAITKLASQC